MKLIINDTPLSADLTSQFQTARPFPLLVVDDFLPREAADGVVDEIGRCDQFRKSNDYIFAKNKFENPSIEDLGPHGRSIRDLLLSPDFAATLGVIYGKPLFVDPEFVGGGLHRGGEGSYLDMHADFALHPAHRDWVRELNILLYLNKGWRPEFGGSLELRDARTGETAAIEPIFNRLVIMLTKEFTFHGYRPIAFPPGSFRTSLAAYAYSQAASAREVAHLPTTTVWKPNDGNALKALVAKVTPQIVTVKQRLLGSSTARKK